MAKIIIVGAGTVGQANGIGLMSKGHEVVFLDIDPYVVDKLRAKSFCAHLVSQFYRDTRTESLDSSIAIFCVPTPYLERSKGENGHSTDGQVDLTSIISAVSDYAKRLKSVRKTGVSRNRGLVGKNIRSLYNHLIVIRSTVPPHTTSKVLVPLIQSNSGMKVGEEIGLCMQPEFLRSSSSQSDFLNPRATVIGEFDKKSGDTLENLYSTFGGQIFRSDIETAEFMKYVQNSFNAAKISFSNEMWLLGQRLGIDANFALLMASLVGEGFWNPGYGITGGQPYDGACLPKDVKGFLSFAKEFGFSMPILSAIESFNSYMKIWSHAEKENEWRKEKLEKGSYVNGRLAR